MPDIVSAISAVATAVLADATIDAYTKLHWEKHLSVLNHVNPRAEPSENDCPFLGISTAEFSRSADLMGKFHRVNMIICIASGDVTPSLSALGGAYIEYPGFALVHGLAALVEPRAINTLLAAGYPVTPAPHREIFILLPLFGVSWGLDVYCRDIIT